MLTFIILSTTSRSHPNYATWYWDSGSVTPLDIVQVVYRIEESNLLRGRARYEPVEDWGDKIPNPPKLETMDPDSIVRVLGHIDPANNEIHHMAMMLAIDIREPSEIQVINNGIGWIGEPTDILS